MNIRAIFVLTDWNDTPIVAFSSKIEAEKFAEKSEGGVTVSRVPIIETEADNG